MRLYQSGYSDKLATVTNLVAGVRASTTSFMQLRTCWVVDMVVVEVVVVGVVAVVVAVVVRYRYVRGCGCGAS